MFLKKILPLFAACFGGSAQAQQVVHANNVQLVTTPGIQVVVQGGMKFTGTTTWKDSSTTTLLPNPVAAQSDWVDSTTGVFISNYGNTIFSNGTNVQQLIGPTKFYDLRLNGIGINLHQSNEVANLLRLDTGLVYFQTASDSLFVSNPAFAAITSTSAHTKSWVNGKLRRNINVAGTGNSNEYLFPIGKMLGPDSLYAPIKIQKNNSTLNSYTAVYFPATPFDPTNILNPPVDHISQVENWEITAAITAGVDAEAKVGLSWRGFSRVSSVQLIRDSLLVVQYVLNPAGRWEKTGSFGLHQVSNPSDSLGGWVKHRDYMGGFDFAQRRFTLGTWSKYNALPLRLLYFNAIPDGNRVRLNWEIRNDQDINVYEIEKSLDGNNFTHLANVSALQRAEWTYTGYDYTPNEGWNYYRLKIKDVSGRFSYSEIRKVRFSKGLEEIRLFPNPAITVVNVQLPSSYSNKSLLQLYTADGKLLSSIKPQQTNVQVNVTGLASGNYFLKITYNNTTNSYGFIKL